jgi:hypothetical protein
MAEERQGQSIYLRWTKTNKGNQIYLRLTNRQTRAINIPTMDEDRQGQSINLTNRQEQSIYLRCNNRQTRTINIPTMDEQIVKSNQNTYNGLTDRPGQSIYLRWKKTGKGNQYTYDGRTDRQGQSIYLRWNNRQTRTTNIPTMDE